MKSKPKNIKIDIFAGIYFYRDQFVFVKRVKGKHIAETKDGTRFRPFDVVLKGKRININIKSKENLN